MQSRAKQAPSKSATSWNVSFENGIPSRVRCADVPEHRIAEESPDDSWAFLESLKNFDCNLHQIVSGEGYGLAILSCLTFLLTHSSGFSSGE